MKTKMYMIDTTNDMSGSGCDMLFETREDAQARMQFWTAKERENCEVLEVEAELQYALYFFSGLKRGFGVDYTQYLDNELVANTNAATEWIETEEEAERAYEAASDYFFEHDLDVQVTLEKVYNY